MVLLPEEAEMTLTELRQMAARQQHQIEAQQQLLVGKEQRLKFLKQQEARHHHLAELKVDPKCLQSLRERVEAQEHKLHHLKALHRQVDQQKTNNSNLGAELQSIRALFSEKEKELNVAVSKVEELMRQLDEIRNNKTQKTDTASSYVVQLENMKRELIYRSKVAEDQSGHICQQRELISQRQHDISELDKKIAELTKRLQRKQLMNQQLANQLHNTSFNRHPVNSHVNLYLNSNVATVEPMQRESQEPEQTRDDLAAKFRVSSHQDDLSEFTLKKNDPKYQTLPYNTKFTLKGKTSQDDSSLQSEDAVSCSSDNSSDLSVVLPPQKSNHGIVNLTPRPFGANYNANNRVSVAKVIGQHVDANQNSENSAPVPTLKASVEPQNIKAETTVDGNTLSVKETSNVTPKPKFLPKSYYGSPSEAPVDARIQKERMVVGKTTTAKPVVPPKPTLPVKPIPPPRQTPTKDRNNSEERSDVVSMALSVLQNKTSSRDNHAFSNYRERLLYYRCIPRYPLQKPGSTSNSTTDSKIVTYFPKSSSSTDSKNQDFLRRKTAAAQLPIKPKPLTIRKTPGIEPPKLKIPPNSNTSSTTKKLQESGLYTSTFKPVAPPAIPPCSVQKEVEKDLNIEDEDSSTVVPKLNAGNNNQFSDISFSANNDNYDESEPFDSLESEKADDEKEIGNEEHGFKMYGAMEEEEDSSSPCDSLECVPIHITSDVLKTEIVSDENDPVHSSANFRHVKGSLKTEGSIRSPRRVSFDPLALLLDAALEGELELVKKTASEVPNPSAANDEGITALHNAICAGHFDVVAFLVDFGCDVNAPDSDGWTPLHCAASCNNLPMVKFLVERGACIFATTLSDHETAAEKCEEEDEGFDGCSEYLYGLQDNMGIMNDGVVHAVYDYAGLNADELSFKDGDRIAVLRNGDDQESEWWWSKLSDEEGYVPRNLLGLFPRISSKRD